MVKKYFQLLSVLIILASVLFIFSSCPPPGEEDNGFIDQVLQGKIGGEDWEFVSGTAEDNGDTIAMNLYDIEPAGGDPWGFGAYFDAENFILFSIDNEEGLYELGFEQTVTLYDYSEGMNYICIEGAVEILEIDAENGELTGRLDAWSDDDNNINGNFTLAYQQIVRDR